MKRRELINVAMGNTPADAIVEGGRLINVATAEIYEADVAIKGDRIAAVGDVAYTKGSSTRVIDAHGRFITPGLVEGHLHQYHSYLGVTEYVEALLSHGVTATADGFYGPGIVRACQRYASSKKHSSGCRFALCLWCQRSPGCKTASSVLRRRRGLRQVTSWRC